MRVSARSLGSTIKNTHPPHSRHSAARPPIGDSGLWRSPSYTLSRLRGREDGPDEMVGAVELDGPQAGAIGKTAASVHNEPWPTTATGPRGE